jgi:hypothetical protein
MDSRLPIEKKDGGDHDRNGDDPPHRACTRGGAFRPYPYCAPARGTAHHPIAAALGHREPRISRGVGIRAVRTVEMRGRCHKGTGW